MGWYEFPRGWISNQSERSAKTRESRVFLFSAHCASAKRDLGKGDILCHMSDILALSESSVADLLAATPKAVRFFIDQGTSCATCPLTRFCKLREVVAIYNLDKDAFFEELAKLNVHTL